MNTKNTRRRFTQSCFPKGFTLIELLVVVLIIGILAAVAVPQYQKVVQKARLTEWATLSNSLMKGLDVYLLENGFPTQTSMVTSRNPGISLDIEAPFLNNCATNTNRCFNKLGKWNIGCSDHHCGISLETEYNSNQSDGNNWLNGGTIQLYRGNDNPQWILLTVPSTEQEQRLICRWWIENYGINRFGEFDGGESNATSGTACTTYL